MNQFVILSFGVDPLNWSLKSERKHVPHLPSAPVDSLLTPPTRVFTLAVFTLETDCPSRTDNLSSDFLYMNE